MFRDMVTTPTLSVAEVFCEAVTTTVPVLSANELRLAPIHAASEATVGLMQLAAPLAVTPTLTLPPLDVKVSVAGLME